MTQEMVSNRIDIDEKHYGKLERGLFTPSLESFFKLIWGEDLYLILLQQYPLFLGIMSFLFVLLLLLIIFNFMSNVTNSIR